MGANYTCGSNTHSRWMAYHYPFHIHEENAGSQVHLTQMYKAFQRNDFEVTLISGKTNDRRQAIQRICAEVHTGRQLHFLYAWSPTVPSLSSQNIRQPFLDFAFFRWCKRQGITIGLFYGDVHWRFPQYKNQPQLKRYVKLPLYWFDWLNYRHWVDCLFLPSLAMHSALPTSWPFKYTRALYPGCNIAQVPKHPEPSASPLRLFYVGGITPPLYDLQPTFEALKTVTGIHLTLCCRAEEWHKMHSYYEALPTSKIQVIHEYGAQLESHYATADIACMFWKMNPYMKFAMPVKLFEALGHGLPVIATTGSEMGDFIQQENIGWTVSSTEEFCDLLSYLRMHPEALAEKRMRAERVRHQHTWDIRAQQVAQILEQWRAPTNISR